MEKDFQSWHDLKNIIHHKNTDTQIFFHEREIWWCHIGMNIGVEQDGKGKTFSRPILIFKKFNRTMFWAIPLSAQLKNSPYYLEYTDDEMIKRSAIIAQLRLISSRRLINKIGHMHKTEFEKIKKAIRNLL